MKIKQMKINFFKFKKIKKFKLKIQMSLKFFLILTFKKKLLNIKSKK